MFKQPNFRNCLLYLLPIILFSCRRTGSDVSFRFHTETFQIGVSRKGFVSEFKSVENGKNYLATARKAPLLAIVDSGLLNLPTSMTAQQKRLFTLTFANSPVELLLKITEKPTHISFTIDNVAQGDSLEAILWGPYPTVISDTIGENIGVVRNQDFAIGIQSLNPKTTAGKLENIQGIVSYHGSAAEKTDFGSILQAFAINRTRDLRHSKWEGWENRYPGRPAYLLNEEDGAVTGSAISLFGCKPEKVLDNIGEIEMTEGLPHPEIDGVWVKKSKETNRAYVISPFSEQNVVQMIAYVKKAGLRSLYHEGPFETWGHFILDKKLFPHGRAGLKACVDKARAAGLNMGVHTLTNFITPKDPFVSPIPDERLVSLGSTTLTKKIDAKEQEIELAGIDMLMIKKKSNLNTIRIEDELIQYGSFNKEKPFVLHDCRRGAFGTKPAAHGRGQTVVHLLDFAYKTFYPNWEMQKEMVQNIVNLLNETGIIQMGFDGHEGYYATGHGDYAMDKYALDWYNLLDHVVVNSSSRFKHFFWHINHFINWGEPWYGGFRESQADRRFKVQPFLERNYLPNMLGWFMIKSTTIPSDAELCTEYSLIPELSDCRAICLPMSSGRIANRNMIKNEKPFRCDKGHNS